MHARPLEVQEKRRSAADAVTVYLRMTLPPVDQGAVHETDREPFPGDRCTMAVPGTEVATKLDDDVSLVPTAFVADTVKV